jgi:hypothetical protein
MSEIKVNSIKGVGASAAAITVNNSDGTCTANLSNRQGKNLIINGGMTIAQRSLSSTGNLYQTVDRFRTSRGNIGSITLTQSQQQLTSSDTPYSSGFRYFHRLALSGAGTVNANGYIGISQRLEAQDVAQSGWDYTSSSSNITLQFWFRCSTNQTFYVAVRSKDGTSQSYVFSFTASGNNTWTKITKTIPGAANVQFDLNNELGLQLDFTPWYGTDYTGSKAINQWSAYSGSAEYPDYASTWLTAGASTFDITGVQLEVGSVATDFEHRSFGQELALCQRYYIEYDADLFQDTIVFSGLSRAGTAKFFTFQLPANMRTDPTITRTGNIRMVNLDDKQQVDGTSNSLTIGGVTPTTELIGTPTGSGDKISFYYNGSISGMNDTGNCGYMMMLVSESGSQLSFDAEL